MEIYKLWVRLIKLGAQRAAALWRKICNFWLFESQQREKGEMYIPLMLADHSQSRSDFNSSSPSSLSSNSAPPFFNSSFTNNMCNAMLAGWGDGNKKYQKMLSFPFSDGSSGLKKIPQQQPPRTSTGITGRQPEQLYRTKSQLSRYY